MKANIAEQTGQADSVDAPVQRLVVRAGGKEWVIHGNAVETPSVTPNELTAEPFAHQDQAQTPFFHSGSWLVRGREFAYNLVNLAYDKVLGSLDLLLQHENPKPRSEHREKRVAALASVRRFRDSFQSGIIMGLALGCLSLVLFHQMNPVSTGSIPQQTQSALSIPGYNNLAITVPSVHLYTVATGSYTSLAAVKAEQAKLAQQGIGTAIHVTGSGQAPYSLVSDVAIYAQDLNSTVRHLAGLGVKSQVVPLVWNAKLVPLNSWNVSKPLADSITHWLSADVSALNALTAAVSDGAAVRDATTAYSYSQSLRPPTAELQSFPEGRILLQVNSATSQAFANLQARRAQGAQGAMQDAVQAYEEIQSLGQ